MIHVDDPGGFAPLPISSFSDPSFPAGGDNWANRLNIAVWSALADSEGRHALPTLSSMTAERRASGESSISDYAPVWVASMQLALYSLGWASPAHGFLRWHDSGFPTDDRRLAIVARLLGEDLQESVTNLLLFLHFTAGALLAQHGLRPLEADDATDLLNAPAWLKRLHESGHESAVAGTMPYGTDNDGMHLVPHCFGPIVKRAEKQGAPVWGAHPRPLTSRTFQIIGDPSDGNATVITDSYTSWYEDLEDLTAGLPKREGGRSWRVDVFCKPVGWLGSFRKSRTTGLWFAGKHSMHEWGNPDLW
jgi:hypothetical protein